MGDATQLATELLDNWSDQYKEWFTRQKPETLERINKRTSYLRHGLATIAPLKCQGPKRCPFLHSCPIPVDPTKPGPDSDYPVHLPCVLESQYMGQRVVDYVEHLKVNTVDPVEMSLVNELALLDLLKNRAVLILSGGDFKGQGRDLMTQDEIITGWDDDGTPRTSVQARVHPAVEIMEKHEKRRTKILDKLVATREAKFKVYGGNTEQNSRLQRDIEDIRKFVQAVATKQLVVQPEHEEPIYLDEPAALPSRAREN